MMNDGTKQDSGLPAGWVWTTLGHVCGPPQYGWTTPATNEGRVRLLRTTDITSGVIDWASVPFCTEEPPNAEKYLLRDGDIVISRAGSVGFSCLIQNPAEAVFASYLIRFRPLIEGKYVGYFLQSPSYWEAISERSLGIAIPNVNASKLRQIPFPLAPLPEQHRIVAEIETQFTRLDAGVAALKRVQANLRRYKATVLKAACEGRLVPTEAELARAEGREYESGAALLARILAERRVRWEQANPGKRYVEPKGVDGDGLADLPEGWVWASMEQLISHLTSGSRGWASLYAESGPLFIRAQNINTDELRLDDIAHVTVPESVEAQRTKVFSHDLLITITGANVTKTALVRYDIGEAYVSQHVGLVRPTKTDTSPYMYLWIVSPANGRRVLEKLAYGAGKPGLNLTNLRELAIALPPQQEQHRIVAEVERRLSVAQEVEGSVAASLRRAERLRQSILKRAFEGRLMA